MGTGVTYSAVARRVRASFLMNTCEKYWLPALDTDTLMRASLILVTVTVVPPTPSVKPFLAAVCRATQYHFCRAGEQDESVSLSLAHTTPASDAASAARCILVAWPYHDPRSTAMAVKASSGMMSSPVIART